MPDDVALETTDTGSVDIADAGSETALTTTTTGTTDVTTTGAETGDGAEETSLEPFRALEPSGRLSKATQTALATLKTSHPELARIVPGALAVQNRLRWEFPSQNPWQGIANLKNFAKEVAALGTSLSGQAMSPRQALEKLRNDIDEMDEIDLWFNGSDPRMIEHMTSEPIGQAAFVKLMPHAFAKYEKLAPNSFSKYIAGFIKAEIVSGYVDYAVANIARLTPKEIMGPDGKTPMPNPVIEELAKIQQFFDRVEGLLKLAPETPPGPTTDPRQADLDRRQQELDRRDSETKAREWKSAADNAKGQIFRRAWDAETKGRKLSAADKEDLPSLVWTNLPIALRNLPGFQETLRGYFEADDRAGYLSYLQAKHQEHIPRLVQKYVRNRFGTPTKAATTTVATGTSTTGQRTAPAEAGFRRIKAAPGANDIKMGPGATTAQMYSKKQAVLRDSNSLGLPGGTKVQWG